MAFELSIHTPWVRNTFKFLAALSIPAVIVGFFAYAKKNADEQFETNHAELMKKKDADQTRVKDYELKEVDDNNLVRWQLVADSGITTDNKKYDLLGVHMKYFDGPNVKMSVVAPTGKVDADTRFVTLTSSKTQKVKGEGDSGKSIFESDTIELDKNNKFFATGNVIIEWVDSAKVTGKEARGKLDKGGMKDVKVTGHTHAVIAVKPDDPGAPGAPTAPPAPGKP